MIFIFRRLCVIVAFSCFVIYCLSFHYILQVYIDYITMILFFRKNIYYQPIIHTQNETDSTLFLPE